MSREVHHVMRAEDFNRRCEALLVRYNRRNAEAKSRRVEGLCNMLRQEGGVAVQTMFGGSVRKRTDVNGLSDVDVLLIVNQSKLANRPPAQVIDFVEEIVSRRMPLNSVETGKMAVTVGYSDGTEIQILPAIRRSNGVRISQPGHTHWSNVVQPERFAEKLIEVNHANGARVVPTIQLAKAIAGCYVKRPSRKIAGYPIECLAVDAFERYSGELDPKSMLLHLFGWSIKAVLTPKPDITEQTLYVDQYLGPKKSRERQRVSTYFGQMRGLVRRCASDDDFDRLFCGATED